MKYKWKQEIFLILAIYLFLASIYFLFPSMPDWDWFNYRAFNCFSFLTDRFNTDFIPTNMRTCINPIVDIPSYLLMFKLQHHPIMFVLISLLDSTVFLYCLIKIITFIFKETKEKTVTITLSVLYVIFLPTLLLQTYFDQNDIKIAAITIIGFYIFIKNIFEKNSKTRNLMFFICGIFLGIATGLKLTAFFSLISLPTIILLLLKKIENPWKILSYYICGAIISFSILDGYWLYKVFAKYNNPFFPYFNDIFKSEYADKIRLIDKDWAYNEIPQNFYDFVFYPFLHTISSDNYSEDCRNIINYISVLILLPAALFRHKNTSETFANTISYGNLYLIILLMSLPCIFNLIIFANERYVISSTALGGILVATLLRFLFGKMKHSRIFIYGFGLILLLTIHINTNYGIINMFDKNLFEKIKTEKFTTFQTNNMNFQDNSVVIFANSGVSTTVIQQNPNVKYVSLFYPKEIFDKYYEKIKQQDKTIDSYTFFSKYGEKYCQDLISNNSNIYLILAKEDYSEMVNDVLDFYNKDKSRKITDCKDIDISVLGEKLNHFKYCKFNKK